MFDAQWKSRESLQWVLEVVSRVWDEMLEQDRGFCPDLAITADQLDPLADASGKDTRSGARAFEPGVNV